MSASPKAYSYVRFSTPEQSKGDSLRRQTDLAAAYAARHKLALDTELTMHDLGVSAYRGKNLDGTSKLGAFLHAIKAGDVPPGSVLLVESLDRISRKEARKAVRVLEEIVEAGVDVVTLGDGEKRYTRDSLDGFDFIMAVLILMRANEESRTKGKRVAQAWSAKRARQAADGETLTRQTPGWIHVDASGERQLIPDRAAVVRRIFDNFLAGLGAEKIAKTLNAERVDTFGRARQWHRSYIHKILRNEAVVGTMTPCTDDGTTRTPQAPIKGYFPPVVDSETFERARSLGETNRSRSKTSTVVRNVLAGLARCPACGGTMTRVFKGSPPKGGTYLVCAAAKVGAGCKYVAVRYGLVEAALIRTARDDIPDADPDYAAHLESAEQTVKQLDRAIAKLVDSIERAPSKALTDRLREREADRERAAEALEELERQASERETKTLRRRKLALRTALTAKPFDAAAVNVALREMVSKVVVDYTRDALIMHWRHDGQSEITYGFGEVSTSEKHKANAATQGRGKGGKFAARKK